MRVDAVVLAAGDRAAWAGPTSCLRCLAAGRWCGSPPRRRGASRAGEVVVVTGHQAERVAAALAGLDVRRAHNPRLSAGLASSLKAGMRALPADADRGADLLGDMPGVTAADLDRLIAAFAKSGGAAIVRATHGGKRGNPVILPRALFHEMLEARGRYRRPPHRRIARQPGRRRRDRRRRQRRRRHARGDAARRWRAAGLRAPPLRLRENPSATARLRRAAENVGLASCSALCVRLRLAGQPTRSRSLRSRTISSPIPPCWRRQDGGAYLRRRLS